MWNLLRRLEVGTLALIAAIGAALLVFIETSDEVTETDIRPIDRGIMLALRTPGRPDDPIGPPTFEEAVRDITALGGVTFLTALTVIAVVTLIFFKHRRSAIVLGVTVLLAVATSEGLKALFGRPRPDLVPHAAYVYSNSFPSGHSMLSAATFLTLAAILSGLSDQWRFKILVFVTAVLIIGCVGASRVYLGVHWPSDVLGGWSLGAVFGLAARLVLGWWRQADKTPEPHET